MALARDDELQGVEEVVALGARAAALPARSTRAWLAQLYTQNGRRLLALAESYCRGQGEDAVQSAFLAAMRQPERVFAHRNEAMALGWLATTIRREGMQLSERSARQAEREEPLEDWTRQARARIRSPPTSTPGRVSGCSFASSSGSGSGGRCS